MRSSRAVLAVVPLLAALVLAGCGGFDGEGAGNGAGGPTSTGPRSSAASPVPSATTGIPTPDAGQTAAIVAALTAVDPNLTADDTQAVSNAVSLCGALQDGDDPTSAVASTFPDTQLDATQQQAVVAAVTSTFCTTAAGGAGSGSATASATGS